MGDEEVAVKLPTKDEITSGLSQVTRTTDGTGWAMAKLDLSEKELSGFGDTLNEFVHIRYLNASGNKIVDSTALGKLTNLLALDISNNELASLPEEQLEYLQVVEQKILVVIQLVVVEVAAAKKPKKVTNQILILLW